MNKFTKAELKVVRDTTLSNKEVAKALNRKEQSIYYKRWSMNLHKKVERVSQGSKIKINKLETIVIGNIKIDLKAKTMTISI